MPVTLYGSAVSPPTRATMMLIEILQIDVKFNEISLPNRDHFKPEYVEKNPQHTIPMLEDGDFIIVDSHAILTYLANKFEREDLYSKDLKTKCIINQRLFFDATILFPRLQVVIKDVMERKSGLTEAHKRNIEEAYSMTEKYLKKTKYIATENLTVADLACISSISSLDHIVPVSKEYVKLHDWWNRLKGESWYVKKNLHGNEIFAMFMKSLLG